jgi:hypothetical protein
LLILRLRQNLYTAALNSMRKITSALCLITLFLTTGLGAVAQTVTQADLQGTWKPVFVGEEAYTLDVLTGDYKIDERFDSRLTPKEHEDYLLNIKSMLEAAKSTQLTITGSAFVQITAGNDEARGTFTLSGTQRVVLSIHNGAQFTVYIINNKLHMETDQGVLFIYSKV